MVSPIVMPSTPAIARMSPGEADGLIDPLQAFEGIQLGNACFLEGAIELRDGHFVAIP